MKKLKFLIYLNLIALILSSCGTVKEGFSNQKKNSTDEFLIEKKSPLVTPPNYGELPIPVEKNEEEGVSENSIKNLISDNKNISILSESNNTLKDSILLKIKKN